MIRYVEAHRTSGKHPVVISSPAKQRSWGRAFPQTMGSGTCALREPSLWWVSPFPWPLSQAAQAGAHPLTELSFGEAVLCGDLQKGVDRECWLRPQGQGSRRVRVSSVWWCWEPRTYPCGRMAP